MAAAFAVLAAAIAGPGAAAGAGEGGTAAVRPVPGAIGTAAWDRMAPEPDFDGNGVADLAIGVPGEGVGTSEGAGAVNVLYGSGADGLTSTDNQIWHQDSSGVLDVAGPSEGFGSALAIGDFDDDGFDDLAVGVPGESTPTITNAGAVNVLYGSENGLSADGDQLWHQDSEGVLNWAENEDTFGSALAAGDFDHDFVDDLAVGVLGEDVGTVLGAGAVSVLYGVAGSGLSAADDQYWTQNSAYVSDSAESSDGFGWSLAAGDLDSDNVEDLAIGVPYENLSGIDDAGAVNVLYGSSSADGLHGSPAQFWHQDAGSIAGEAEDDDHFGEALATGDLDGNSVDDLAVGVRWEGIGSSNIFHAGAVNVIYGTAAEGLTSDGNQVWHQNTTGILGTAEAGDEFGYAVAAGDFNGDTEDDLAIGVKGEDVTTSGFTYADCGTVNVIYSQGLGGLGSAGNQVWSQDSSGVEDACLSAEFFGSALAAADFGNGPEEDVAIGVPGEGSVGAVNVLYGYPGDLSSTDDQLWSQDSLGINGIGEADDEFGAALAARSD